MWPLGSSDEVRKSINQTDRATFTFRFSMQILTADQGWNAWSRARDAAELPHVTPYEGSKHTMATTAIRCGDPERALRRFLGHASVLSTRRYARLADHALIEVLRPAKPSWRQIEQRRGHLDARSMAIAVAIPG